MERTPETAKAFAPELLLVEEAEAEEEDLALLVPIQLVSYMPKDRLRNKLTILLGGLGSRNRRASSLESSIGSHGSKLGGSRTGLGLDIGDLGLVVLGLACQLGVITGKSDKVLKGLHLEAGSLGLRGGIDDGTGGHEGGVGGHGSESSGSNRGLGLNLSNLSRVVLGLGIKFGGVCSKRNKSFHASNLFASSFDRSGTVAGGLVLVALGDDSRGEEKGSEDVGELHIDGFGWVNRIKFKDSMN